MDNTEYFKILVEKIFELKHSDINTNTNESIKDSVKLCNFLQIGLIRKNLEKNFFEIIIITDINTVEKKILELNDKITEKTLYNLIPHIQETHPNVNTIEDVLFKLEEEILNSI